MRSADKDFPETGICSLCDLPYDHWGNNPEPVSDHDDRCCDACNDRFVIPARKSNDSFPSAQGQQGIKSSDLPGPYDPVRHPMTTYGVCSACGELHTTTAKHVMRVHGPRHKHCPGSGKPPERGDERAQEIIRKFTKED